jgi:CelD/BcsL family acetyltransferase involved in cellulose biosynthesis
MWGLNVLTSFAGTHVGSNAPLVDRDFLSGLDVRSRHAFWYNFTRKLHGADLAYICQVPGGPDVEGSPFEGLGLSVPGDQLHRSAFSSWAQCDAEQRSRSRRKHDKQQGQKLQAMGQVAFEVVEGDGDTGDVLDAMFAQRAERFRMQGIPDPFSDETVRNFYRNVMASGETLKGRLHVMRLDGEVVAVRYNLVAGDRMFCLISSMSVAPEIQPGSPGKQCLLRVMQTEFDGGVSMFDMGAGMTDEKRHWCNVHIPLNHHYVPLSACGQMFALAHATYQKLKAGVKENKTLFALAKTMRARLGRQSNAA